MKQATKIKWAFAAAIAVSVCWLVGDIAVVGFEPRPGDYPLFSKDYADKVDVDMAVHMLKGSTGRLMFGALIGALTGPLLLAAMWLVRQFFAETKKWYAVLTYYILLAGAVLSPAAHAAFFYVGEIHKAIYHTDKMVHPYLIGTANGFVQMLTILWGTAIFVLAVGWLAFAVCIALRKTLLPRWFAIFTPVALTLIIIPIKNVLPAPYSGWVGGAVFNIAYLVFFLLLLMLFRKKPLALNQKQSEKIINNA
ncbi:DUF6796 family protein [Sphingobacterium sp. JB170]|uniref:DUF6796 family protein n=1 Tax=Sphingobacterium sp. JB170 TaxID=1434842 RepID=UPI00097F3DF1|nr:DUF6796 family protein [Sphingobacterium sp. JB170]SJN22603.1 hypothetical protein FM107_03420 [Sphingobacterium sp. JB170]